MWTYEQESGWLGRGGASVARGYSGHGECKNRPDDQERACLGPIPRGFYKIHAPVDTATHGPYVLKLEPFPETVTFGRSGFLMHGDSKSEPGEASLGCIIMPRLVREQVWKSGDDVLEVIA